MNKKLLDKTLRVYVLYALVVFSTSTPLFYFLANRLFMEDADDALLLRKLEFIAYHQPILKAIDIPVWNKFNRDVKIEEGSKVSKDSIFFQSHMDTLANEMDPYRVLISPVTIEGRPFTLNVQINLIETTDIIESILFLFCLILITLLIGLFFITKRLSKKLWRPFYTTLEQMEQFELDKNINTEFAQSDTEEFSRLNQSVSTLLTRNAAVYNSQKEFIENAAHELQTPLAVFQAKLDTLIQQLPFSNELGNTLSDLTEAASRLNRLNKNLLLLSKIENNQYVPTEEILANDFVKKLTDFFTEQAEEKNISVQINQIALLAIKANTTLFEIIISNLLLNALRHNKLNGKIVVTLDQRALTISNTSSAKALSTEKLFHRFSHHGSQGSGLGLAIVKKISDLHEWKIDYSYQEEMHIFRILF